MARKAEPGATAMDATNVTLDLLRWAQATPDAPALVLPGERLSYRQLDTLTWQCSRYLHDQGVRPGDVVATTFMEDAAQAVALLAAARLGAAGLSLARNAGAAERRGLAIAAGARCLLTDRPALFEAGLPTLALDIRALSRHPQALTAGLLAETPVAPWQLIQGSGSTGTPKLLPVTHAQARARFAGQVAASGFRPGDCLAGLSRLDYSLSKHRLGWALAAGAAYAIIEQTGVNPLELLQPLGVTFLAASVVHAEYILRDDRPADLAALSRIGALSLSGSSVGDALRARLRARIGDRLWIDYGSNEAGHLALAKAPELYETPGTVGRIVPGVELQVVDADGRRVPDGTEGRVRVRGPGMIEGYWRDAEATARHFRDGWFHPGDLARWAPDGQLIHLGRADRVMIHDGINIDPVEIERVMSAHPAVGDAVALPVRSPVHHDIPVCAVALRRGHLVSEQELLTYAQDWLGPRGPRRVAILESLPRSGAGKLLQPQLVEALRAHFGLT
ncbi:MAG: long-chain fatty acid--CoA ligase [Dongiaceae bacterium]